MKNIIFLCLALFMSSTLYAENNTVLTPINLNACMSSDDTFFMINHWWRAFTINNAKTSLNQRVMSYSNMQSIHKDMQLQHKKGQRTISDALYKTLNCFEQQVNFEKFNLVALYMSDGGPPFGTLSTQRNQQEITFCLKKKPHPLGISGMALRIESHLYLSPKDITVQLCKTP